MQMSKKAMLQSYLDLGGTIRSQSTLATLERLQAILSQLGITRVANVTGLDCLNIPVAICIRPNSKHLSVSQGKGLTWELAKISAIMESIEGYHAENPKEPAIYGAYSELSKHYPMINPYLFVAGALPISYLENWQMSWARAEEINSNHHVFIPYALSCLDSSVLHPEYSFFNVSSNGLAAGNSIEEALCHAIYEVIERDALYHWSKLPENERATTSVNLDTINSLLNKTILENLSVDNQHVKIWDITSKLGIPTYHCVIQDTHPLRRLGIFGGTGTHLLKEIALSRAMTEAAQSRLTLISGSRDDVFNDHYYKKVTYQINEDKSQGEKNFQSCFQPFFEASFTDNLNFLKKTLIENQFSQIFVLNHTNDNLNIPVVHVFIPGMKYSGKRL